MYENKKILIIGAAKSGISVAKLLANRNNEITITDLNDIDEYNKQLLKSLNIKIVITNNQVDLLNKDWDLIIKNPAIMYTSNIVKRCKELNLHVENEMEVAYHFLPKDVKIIGVTGSNGKTTTCTILYKILKNAGLSVVLGGNIGTPLSELVPTIKAKDIILLEISDHQLCDLFDFKTDISILTNICPTHLDYHGTYEHYKMTKRKIFNNHTSNDYAIINKESLDALEVSSYIPSKKYYFSSKTKADSYYNNGFIYLNNELYLDTKNIKLKGIHNYENIMASLLVCNILHIKKDVIVDFLKSFNGVEHRLEFVKTVNGVEYYNDTKSTNPTSTITALKTFDKKINLILGGLNRNQDYHELDNYMSNVVNIFAIGETTDIVSDYAKSINIPCKKEYTLDKAMQDIKNIAKNGEIVLLSTASSSQDQYPHFEDRGIEFKNIVEKF